MEKQEEREMLFWGAALVQVKDAETALVVGIWPAHSEREAAEKHYLYHVARWPEREIEFLGYSYVPVSLDIAREISKDYSRFIKEYGDPWKKENVFKRILRLFRKGA